MTNRCHADRPAGVETSFATNRLISSHFSFFIILSGEFPIDSRKNRVMKKTYHLCLSGGDEVLFRDEEDYIRGNNCLCLAAHKTGSTLLAYSEMSNHAHIGVRTEAPELFMKAFWYPYNRYFNRKYSRSGRLGEEIFFSLEIEGLYHLLTAIAYILRNPLHHGVAATPFGYRYSSISALFRRELGRFEKPILMPEQNQRRYIPNRERLPEGFRMDVSGLILPESVIDVADVEHQFSTARTFLYYMNRVSGEAWEKEQTEDLTSLPPITLDEIERGVALHDVRTMLANEHGRANYHAVSDIQLCEEIDKVLLRGERSVYRLSSREKSQIAEIIFREYRVPVEQIRRCLGGSW